MAETSARGEGDGGKCDGFQDTNPILLNIMQNFNNSLIQKYFFQSLLYHSSLTNNNFLH